MEYPAYATVNERRSEQYINRKILDNPEGDPYLYLRMNNGTIPSMFTALPLAVRHSGDLVGLMDSFQACVGSLCYLNPRRRPYRVQ